jgi:hypothetical protein
MAKAAFWFSPQHWQKQRFGLQRFWFSSQHWQKQRLSSGKSNVFAPTLGKAAFFF